MQDELTRRGFERVMLWPPAVDSELFHPDRRSDEMRWRLSGGHSQSPLLLTVSRLAPEKNVAFLARVMEQLADARLAVVGDGPQRAELQQRFPSDRTTFHGYLTGQQLASAYASVDAFAYASETETMGNVVLEAMASGVPVVAPRAGGIPSLVTHGTTGLLFSPGDVREAATLIRQILSRGDRRQSIVAAARQSACACDWKHAAQQVRQCYDETIAHHAAGAVSMARRRRMAPFVLTSLILGFRVSAALQRAGKAGQGAASSRSSRIVPASGTH
jgi:glycosyltransferase involved in cell wall biosynthesis